MEDLISACRKHVVAATGSSSFKVGDNQRPERTMSGAAKIFAGFPLHDNLSTGTEDSGEGFRVTGHGPFRPLIVSNLKWGGPCRDHYVFPAGRYQIFRNSFIRAP